MKNLCSSVASAHLGLGFVLLGLFVERCNMACSSKRPSARPPAILRLEQLEDRTMPSSPGGVASASAVVVQPPSQFQALLSLYIDAAYLESFNLTNAYVTNFGANAGALDEFGFVPSITSEASARAAAAGINFNSLMSLNNVLGTLLAAEGLQLPGGALNDIQFNLPYAGPFAPLALSNGAQGVILASGL
jgi:hypothetical protein